MKTVALELQPCCGTRSGIGTYVWELSRRLQDDDELHFCGNVFNVFGRRYDLSRDMEGLTIPVSENRVFSYGMYRRIWNAVPVSYDRLFPNNADVSVFFNYIVPPRVKGRIITTVCDMTWLRFPETMAAGNRRRLMKGMARSLQAADRIITISEFSKREILELLSVPEERIAVIPCAAHCTDDSESYDHLSAKYGIRKPYLLYVGTIEPRKNLVRLLRAFELLKEKEHIQHQLVLAGGRGWNPEEFDTALAASPVKDSVVRTGYITDSEKNTLYQNADLFVFPSLYEGFGIPPLEAMHWGCPVVSADAASLPEVVGDAAVLVNPMEEESIAAGIWKVLSNVEYADGLREKGYQQEKNCS